MLLYLQLLQQLAEERAFKILITGFKMESESSLGSLISPRHIRSKQRACEGASVFQPAKVVCWRAEIEASGAKEPAGGFCQSLGALFGCLASVGL